MRIEISPGELADRMTILDIKIERIKDPQKLANVQRERAANWPAFQEEVSSDPRVHGLCAELRKVNETLWDVEDAVRECERRRGFGAKFIRLARSVYRHNDRRAALKREINVILGSGLIEEKSYAKY